MMEYIALALAAGAAVLSRTENYPFVIGLLFLASFLPPPVLQAQKLAFRLTIPLALFATLFSLLWGIYCERTTGSAMQSSAIMKQIFRAMENENRTTLEIVAASFETFYLFVGKAFLRVPSLKYLILLGLAHRFFRNKSSRTSPLVYGFFFLAMPLCYGALYAAKLPRTHLWYYPLSILALSTLAALIMNSEQARQFRRTHPLLVAVLALLVSVEAATTTAVLLQRGRNTGQVEMLYVARNTLSELPADSRIGAWNAGIYGYFSGRTVINLDGLINAEIAEAYYENQLNWPYWEKRQLTHLVDDERWFSGVAHEYKNSSIQLLHKHEADLDSPILLYQINRRTR